MAYYYVNDTAQTNGDHEVHKSGCYWLGLVNSKTSLGDHLTCVSAVRKAKEVYATADGCKHCSPDYHTG